MQGSTAPKTLISPAHDPRGQLSRTSTDNAPPPHLSSILFLSTRGCFSHWLSSRCPWGVRHLFRRPARECVPAVSSGEAWGKRRDR